MTEHLSTTIPRHLSAVPREHDLRDHGSTDQGSTIYERTDCGSSEHENLLKLGFPRDISGRRVSKRGAYCRSAFQRTAAKPRSLGGRPLDRWRQRLRIARWQRALRRLNDEETGAVTAEYALIITAAVAFAGLLIIILRSDEVRSALLGIVQNALNSAG